MLELFNKLDKYINKEKLPTKKTKCCTEPEIYFNNEYLVCHNCGRITDYYEEIDMPTYLNPKFQLKTYIGGFNRKYRHIHRLNLWDMDYRENTANNSCYDITRLCKKYNLNYKIVNKACYLYKYIYIKNNITSRNKIKLALYIICIKKAASFNNEKLNLKTLLNDNNLSMANYNKAYLKIKHLKELN